MPTVVLGIATELNSALSLTIGRANSLGITVELDSAHTLTGRTALTVTFPPASANSSININLGNVPQVEDPQVYEALLNIHSAFDIVLKALEDLQR